jgi:hypothetical protein
MFTVWTPFGCIMQVVLVVRGTTSLADTLTDLSGHLVPFGGGAVEGDIPEGDLPDREGAEGNSRGSSSSTAVSSREPEKPDGMAHNGILRAAPWGSCCATTPVID